MENGIEYGGVPQETKEREKKNLKTWHIIQITKHGTFGCKIRLVWILIASVSILFTYILNILLLLINHFKSSHYSIQ